MSSNMIGSIKVKISGKMAKYTPRYKGKLKVEEVLAAVLSNMKSKSNGNNLSLILSGDVGVGKSSIMQSVVRILGLNLLMLEAPSLSADDLVELPFMVIDKQGTSEEKIDIKMLDSQLLTKLKKFKRVPTRIILSPFEKKLKSKYGNIINKVLRPKEGSEYTVVFVIDEFYRTGNKNVQNILRNILNGKLGNAPLPSNTYTLFASNLVESGGTLDEIAMNNDFVEVDFDKNVSVNNVLATIHDYASEDTHTKGEVPTSKISNSTFVLYEKLLADAGNAVLIREEDEDLEEGPTRLSPRTIEMMMRTFDNFKVKTKKDFLAFVLLTKAQFSSYTTNSVTDKMSALCYNIMEEKYIASMRDLNPELAKRIELSPDSYSAEDELDEIEHEVEYLISLLEEEYSSAATAWKDALEYKIEEAIEMGEQGIKTKPPVLASSPGMTKTTTIRQIAFKKNYGLIEIDCSTLTPDDVKPMSFVEDIDNEEVTVTEAPLYRSIMKEYATMTDKKSVILFLDEFNRAPTSKIFNAVRQVLLDKAVAGVKLESNIIVVTAINPVDLNTQELSLHVRDVIDVLPVVINYKDVIEYVESQSEIDEVDKLGDPWKIGSFVINFAKELFENSLENAPSSIRSALYEENPYMEPNDRFYYYVDNVSEPLYISPRNIVSAIKTLLSDIELKLELGELDDLIDENNIQDLKLELGKIMKESLEGSFSFIAKKSKLDKAEADAFTSFIFNIVGDTLKNNVLSNDGLLRYSLRNIPFVYKDYKDIFELLEELVADKTELQDSFSNTSSLSILVPFMKAFNEQLTRDINDQNLEGLRSNTARLKTLRNLIVELKTLDVPNEIFDIARVEFEEILTTLKSEMR